MKLETTSIINATEKLLQKLDKTSRYILKSLWGINTPQKSLASISREIGYSQNKIWKRVQISTQKSIGRNRFFRCSECGEPVLYCFNRKRLNCEDLFLGVSFSLCENCNTEVIKDKHKRRL